MNTLDIPDEYRDRIETLRAELADEHAGPYATVEPDDVLAYLLDLAEAVDDPERKADPGGETDSEPEADPGGETDSEPEADPEELEDEPSTSTEPLDRETVREQLADRNRKHAEPDDGDRMDLYTIAAELDVTGRSGMTKDELIAAILDRAAALAADPFSAVGVDINAAGDGGYAEADISAESGGDGGDDDANTEAGDQNGRGEETDGSEGSGSSQLDAMMSLLDTHDDKWREGDGDVRYEVDLPDGGVETARTKDDVRALLFRNY